MNVSIWNRRHYVLDGSQRKINLAKINVNSSIAPYTFPLRAYLKVHKDNFSFDWKLALWACVNGPVAGSTFILAIKFAVHSPEAFEPFYLHVSGMLLMMKMRYLIIEYHEQAEMYVNFVNRRLCYVIGTGHLKLYLRWAIPYGLFLSIQPFIPYVQDMLTLFDYNLHGGEVVRDMPYWRWVVEVWCYVAAHAVMATVGMVGSALSF